MTNKPLSIRYAILTSVSTPEQARQDKISLDHQLLVCQAAAESNAPHGWHQTSGPFIIDGYSRSSYVNLSDAERDIPPLRAALTALRNNLYDLLIIFSYDRLGDLTPFLSNEFRNYKKQIYSVTQPSIVQNPLTYNPYLNESADIQQDAARMVQRFRINDLRRKWYAGLPARIERGLTPLKISFGYRWVGKKEPPAQIETECTLIYKMKDWLLSGVSMNEIANRANRAGIPSPHGNSKWDPSSIRYILSNPYYAGRVTFHKTRTTYDESRKSKHRPIPQPPSQWKSAEGKHVPLWDDTTHRAILAELDRRRQTNQSFGVRFPLSGLLYCSVCKQKLHRRTHGWHSGRRKVLSCQAAPAHVILPYDHFLPQIADAIQDQLIQRQLHTPQAAQEDAPKRIQSSITKLDKTRKRIQQGYEAGIYTAPEAAAKLAVIDSSTEDLHTQLQRLQLNRDLTSQVRQSLTSHDLTRFSQWIQTDDPANVHRVLSALCHKITLTPSGDIHIDFRD